MDVVELKEWMNEKFQDNKDDHKRLMDRADLTNGRVRSLEKWRWAIGGALTLLGVMVTILGTVVMAIK